MRQEETKTIASLDGSPPGSAAGKETLPGPHLEPGVNLGRYVVLYRVGSGGMGVIYAAYDSQLDRKVALKILRSDLDSPGRRDLLRREAKAMARLLHPNTVRVYDVGEDRRGFFIAMEYVAGPTLRQWLAEKPRRWREVLAIFLQAGRGLEGAHAAGLVHQDFKPSNVILGAGRRALVTDFGLARLRARPEAKPGAAPMEPHLLGTPAYFAPERAAGQEVDVKSDQFSFCAALYHALFDQLPFAASDPGAYLEEARKERIRPPRPGRGVPRRMQRALWRGLRADPKERYPSMADLLADLSTALRRPLRQRLALSAGLLALVTALATYGVLGSRQAAPCAGAATRMDGVWGEELRERLRRAFLATEGPLAEEALESVERALDRYSKEWVSMYTEACEATHVHGDQSERTLDLRMWCLDDRLVELRALTEVLSRSDPEVAIHAGDAVAALRSVAMCADRPELDRIRLPSLDAPAKASVDDARSVVETQYALLRTGGQVDVAAVERSVEIARDLSYSPLEARATQLLSNTKALQEGDFEAAEKLLRAALRAAMEAGDHRLLIILYAQLGELVGFEGFRSEESLMWLDFGEAILKSLGSGHDEEALILQHSEGVVAMHSGELEVALSRLRRAHETGERLWGPEDPRLGSVLTDLGIATADSGDMEKALVLLKRSVALREKAAGRSNPLLGPPLVTLASIYAGLGRYPQALETAGRAREVIAAFHGEEHWSLAYPDLLSGQILVAADRPEAAAPRLERALGAFRGSFGEAHPLVAEAWMAMAEAALLERRYAEATGLLESASDIELPPPHRLRGNRELLRGRLYLEKGAFESAEEVLLRASDAHRETPLPALEQIWLRNSLGALFLQRGQLEDAATQFRETLALGEGRDPQLVAEARFGLARALAQQSQPGATALARQARDSLERGSPRTRELRRAVEQWLATHRKL